MSHHHPIQQHVDEDYSIKDKVVVVLEGTKGKAFEVDVRIENELVAKITPLDEHNHPAGPTETVVVSELDWHSERPLGEVKFREEHSGDDEHRTVQFLGNTPEGFKIRLFGSEQEVIVRTPKEHQFSKHMLAPEVKDFSKFLVSPMPGTLISCSTSRLIFSCVYVFHVFIGRSRTSQACTRVSTWRRASSSRSWRR